MDHNLAEVIINRFVQRYPHLALELDEDIRAILPKAIFTDYDLLPLFLQEFCTYRNIEQEEIIGRHITSKYLEYRKEFLAVLLLLYHPEKIHGITRKRTWQGIQNTAAEVLQCSPKSLANFIPEVITWFQRYKDFRIITTEVHEVLLEKFIDREGCEKTRTYEGFTVRNTQTSIF